MNSAGWDHNIYLFHRLDFNNDTEIIAAKPSSQPNINIEHEKLKAEEFLPLGNQDTKRRSSPSISPARNKTPVDSTRAQTMSQYDLLEASDYI
jgi:hypothetical protein